MQNHGLQALTSPQVLGEAYRHQGPLVLVGLPRSGSSMVADAFSRSGSAYVFDDLYLTEEFGHLIDKKTLSESDLDAVLYWLGWQIRARFRHKPFSLPAMTEDDVDPMNEALKIVALQNGFDLFTLQREWLVRLMLTKGQAHWGYNHPKSFLSVDTIVKHEPHAKFVFLFRAPDRVLASYKHMPKGHNDGDARRYHPVFYGYYWRSAVRVYQQLRTNHAAPATHVLFEDVIKDPQAELERVASVFDLPHPENVSLPPANSSFGAQRKALTALEVRILRSILANEADHLGYRLGTPSHRWSDIPDVIARTFVFSAFQAEKLTKRALQRAFPNRKA